jgi:hypothetical protein
MEREPSERGHQHPTLMEILYDIRYLLYGKEKHVIIKTTREGRDGTRTFPHCTSLGSWKE